jgi:hypothetical protein
VNDPAPLERDRDLARLLDDTVALYRRYLAAALALAAAVVIPVEIAVSGIGLGELTSSYDDKPSSEALGFASLVSVLITTPLVTGMLVRLVLADEREPGEQRSVARAAAEGLESFGPLVGAVLLATLGVLLGFVALVVPGVILAVRWVVVAPAVVVEGRRGTAALRRSWELVTGHSWWTFGVMIVTGLIVGVLGIVLSIPFDALAKSADSQALTLIGTIVSQIVGLPFSAFATALLYFTLKARHEGTAGGVPAARGAAPYPPPPEAPEAPFPPAGAGAAEPPPAPGDWEPPVPPR